MVPRGVILVQGTAGWTGTWWQPRSFFVRHLERHGFFQVTWPNGKPFRWTTALNGLRALRRWVGLPYEPRDWLVGGEALSGLLSIVRHKYGDEHLNVIAHSHGLWPAILAASEHTPIRCLLSIAPPGRADMRAEILAARPHIRYWVLVVDRDFDVWAALGGIGDGAVGVDRTFGFLPPPARPDLIIHLPDVGHSKLLEAAGAVHWDDDKLFEIIHLAGRMPAKERACV